MMQIIEHIDRVAKDIREASSREHDKLERRMISVEDKLTANLDNIEARLTETEKQTLLNTKFRVACYWLIGAFLTAYFTAMVAAAAGL